MHSTRNHVTTICIGVSCNYVFKTFHYKHLLLKVTMYSYYKWYPKNGSHILMAVFSVLHILGQEYIFVSPKTEARNWWLQCMTILGVIKAKFCLQSAECWVLSAECWLLSAECWVLSAEYWVLSAECWLLCAKSVRGKKVFLLQVQCWREGLLYQTLVWYRTFLKTCS